MTSFIARFTGWLVAGACISIGLIGWIGFRAVLEWQRSAVELANRRADEGSSLLTRALSRDMHSVQSTLLPSTHFQDPSRLRDNIASALARYPYPEVFFVSDDTAGSPSLAMFARAERLPAWLTPTELTRHTPLVRAVSPPVGTRLLARIGMDGGARRPFSIFDLNINDVDYQVVASLSYDRAFTGRPRSVIGFLVNLKWVRTHYFQQLTSQVTQIASPGKALRLAILDERGASVIAAGSAGGTEVVRQRPFMVAFFDPLLTALNPPPDLALQTWTVRATTTTDPALLPASVGPREGLVIVSVAALILALSIVFTYRAARAAAELATMRADFVAAVTHELKTPLATIRVVSDTLASGRGGTETTRRTLARLAGEESKKLTRLVDNLLAYSRISDVTDAYTFEPVQADSLIETCLSEFSSRLALECFEVTRDFDSHLRPVRADRTAASLLFGNLIDNAIRYSNGRRVLRIRVRGEATRVAICIADQGIGIPDSDLAHVTRRFYRSKAAPRGGSGLGLAIAERIVTDHGGLLAIDSAIGTGTTVTVSLPFYTDDKEEDSAG